LLMWLRSLSWIGRIGYILCFRWKRLDVTAAQTDPF
jgi:hypothetical protein